MNSFLLALQMLTRIYIKYVPYEEKTASRSVLYFPIIGLVLGAVLIGLAFLFHYVFPAPAVAAVVVVGMVVLTGGLHMDGFMDTLDGVLSGRPRERKLEIMKDSRVGAFGVLGLACLLLLKYGLVISLPAPQFYSILLFMPILSRWAMAYATVSFPYARKEGFGKSHAAAGKFELGIATILTIVLAILICGPAGVVCMALVGFLAWFLCKKLVKQLGGLTGDTYGAVNETMEVAVLLLFFPLYQLMGPYFCGLGVFGKYILGF